MLADCLQVFEAELRNKSDDWLLDRYMPKEGIYVLIDMDHDFALMEQVEIGYDKKADVLLGKENLNFKYICFLDYYSKLIEMNKPIDPQKTIHSNNLYSLFIKKESLQEGKLTEGIIDGYYDVLSDPRKKYTKPKAKELYEDAVRRSGEVDLETVEKIRAWVKQWSKDPAGTLPVKTEGKDYLKLFFVYEDREKTKELFKRENDRYLIPNIYNNNDFNRVVKGTLTGLPGNNMGMNSKKPYLENKSRKVNVPYLLNLEKAILQGKFFDYLWSQAATGKYNIYVDIDNEEIRSYTDREDVDPVGSGVYLRVRKAKNEAEILWSDVICSYQPNLVPNFEFKNILGAREEEIETKYGRKTNLAEVKMLFDDVLFGKKLVYNFFTKPEDLSFNDRTLENILLTYRDRLFQWFYENSNTDMESVFVQMSMKLILLSVQNDHWNKVKHQLNLAWSIQDYFRGNRQKEEEMKRIQQEFKKHVDMYKEDWDFIGDGEYYYGLGQMIAYFLTLSKAAKKPLSIANQFLNASNDKVIKEKLVNMFKKYSYDIDSREDVRIKNILSRLLQYVPRGEVQQDMIVAGLTGKIAFYEKRESTEKGGME